MPTGLFSGMSSVRSAAHLNSDGQGWPRSRWAFFDFEEELLRRFRWGESIDSLGGPFDLCVGSDVTYEPRAHGALLRTLSALLETATAAPPRWREKYEVRLLDGASWKTLDSAALEEDEWIMGTCAAQLKDEAFPSGKIFVNVLAVGTAYQEGEDTGSRGRVLLYSANEPEAEAAEGGDANGLISTSGGRFSEHLRLNFSR